VCHSSGDTVIVMGAAFASGPDAPAVPGACAGDRAGVAPRILGEPSVAFAPDLDDVRPVAAGLDVFAPDPDDAPAVPDGAAVFASGADATAVPDACVDTRAGAAPRVLGGGMKSGAPGSCDPPVVPDGAAPFACGPDVPAGTEAFAPGSEGPCVSPGDVDTRFAGSVDAAGSCVVLGSCVGLTAPVGLVDEAAGFAAGPCELRLPGASINGLPFPRCSMYTLFDMLFCA
jgi:hypothetical protein